MGWWSGNNYHQVSPEFNSPTMREATKNWALGVVKGMIGDVGKAIGAGFAFGDGDFNAAVAGGQFVRSAWTTIQKETVKQLVWANNEWNTDSVRIEVTHRWTGPHPLDIVAVSHRDLPPDFRNVAIRQENNTNDNGFRATFADGKVVVWKSGCVDMYGTAKAEYLEGCNKGRNLLSGGDGGDILKGNGNNDKLYGGSGNDRIYGGDDNDTLSGGSGDDFVFGGNGNDRLSGDGAGHMDYLYGQAGADVFDLTGDRNVTVMDFQKEDRVVGFDLDQARVWRHTDTKGIAYIKIEWQNAIIKIAEDGGAAGVWWTNAQIEDYLLH